MTQDSGDFLHPRPQEISLSGCTIETLQPSDIETYIDIFRIRMGEDNHEDNIITSALIKDYERRLQNSNWILLIAKKDQKIVGGLEAEIIGGGERSQIRWGYVDQRFRRKGIATDLYTRCEDVLAKKGVSEMVVFIDDRNIRSRKFHGTYGFEPVPDSRSLNGKLYRKLITRS